MRMHDRQILCNLLKHPGNSAMLSQDAGHSAKFWQRLKLLAKHGLVRTASYGGTTWAAITKKGVESLAKGTRRKPGGVLVPGEPKP